MDGQSVMFQTQRQCFAILSVVYASEYPITLETIAFQVRKPFNWNLGNLVDQLVLTGHLQIHIYDGIVNYCKPSSPRLLLPLPYFYLFD